ncbi:MAG: c-type cytochrome [Elusimicrobia bacterium]|nr:c-type cytochrome [Elusimicrobiota bacterium]
MKRFLPLFVIALAASVGAWASHGPDKVKLGKQYFDGFGCQRCHNIAGAGGDYGPDLTYVGFRKSREWLDLWLRDPHGWKPTTAMPNLHLSDPVREALVAYLYSLKGDAYRLSTPWNHKGLKEDPVKRGEALFNRVGCVGCHGRAGVGGNPNNNVAGNKIPTLTLVADGFSREELVGKIKVGVPKPAKDDPTGPEPLIGMPAWGQVLKDDEIEAIADYLISLKPKGAAASQDDW